MTEVVEAPGAESAQELKRITHWINGTSVAGEPGRSGPVYNPAAGIQTGEVDFASAEEVDRAVQAAKEAFASWRAVSLSRTTEIFFRIRALVDVHREDISKILAAEHGKVLSDREGATARGLQGGLDGGGGRRRGGRARWGDQGAPAEGEGRRRDAARRRDGAARHTRASRQGRVVHRQGSRRGRHRRH